MILSSEFGGDVVIPANANMRYEQEDILDILRSPVAFKKLSLESLAFLEGKEVLEKLLGMQLMSSELVTSIQAANESTDKHTSPNHQTKATSSISYLIHSFPSPEKDSSNLHKIPVLPCGLDECGLKEDRTYLVAGGLRGFGFEVARWMAENGAKSIGLIGRSKPSDGKCQEIREMEERTGAKIYTFQVCLKSPGSYKALNNVFFKTLKTYVSKFRIFVSRRLTYPAANKCPHLKSSFEPFQLWLVL